MSKPDEGGFVYPIVDWDLEHQLDARGITRRDDLAKAAMLGAISAGGPPLGPEGKMMPNYHLVIDSYTKFAYAQADAMIAEGKKE